ncbi:maleylpyruvate isomerase family mycothiol-dependent enzyme [Nocardioides sp. KC13]|uniref:Maleylpyruvate isomerase family mycothiol-dependent enzyme n=1 Tax=Nocardioides turkmenicus TaxID=2711220 RepID=A0A6M1R6N7_9ACTN|nr:maleylpyruvate isomerase family mycothiol-dependent enzyme [Nocardioides sp. KC13]NGN93289.1 maleylpyruvate isomerase family mycothiol-dependent enzyme [Nocardioides sp. KC13]
MDVAARTADNRRLLADFFDGLDESQLETQSLCSAWTVRQVLGHSAMPFSVGIGRLLWRTLLAGGSIDRAAVAIAEEQARRPVAELTGLLRTYAGKRVPAPGVGPMGQFTDHCIHLRDCARPLGLDTDVPLEDWRAVLDWLPTKQASLGVVPAGRLDGLALRATDQNWSWGADDGAEVSGPSEALAMALSGRSVALADLTGPGVATLRERLG